MPHYKRCCDLQIGDAVKWEGTRRTVASLELESGGPYRLRVRLTDLETREQAETILDWHTPVPMAENMED